MLGMHLSLPEYLDTFGKLLHKVDAAPVERLAEDLHAAYENGRTVFLAADGPSAALAAHAAAELSRGILHPKCVKDEPVRRLRVVSLCDSAMALWAWAEGEGIESALLEPLKALAAPDDLLIAWSTDGESPAVLRAVEWARRQKLRTWGLTGYHGGELRRRVRRCLRVPLGDPGIVESAHLLIVHWIVDDLHARISGAGRHDPEHRILPLRETPRTAAVPPEPRPA